jgi:hypothetical protein
VITISEIAKGADKIMSVAVSSEYLAVVGNLPKGTKLSAESFKWEEY